jgi:membrane associated rhomboid family serine protease
MPRKTLPKALGSREPAFFAVALSTALVLAVTFIDWASPQFSFASSQDLVFGQQKWHLLFLAMLSHADTPHLLSNLLGFVTFGILLKRSFGWLAFPIAPAICGVVITLLTNVTTPQAQGLIGSSGIVFAMVGLYVTLYYFFEHRHTGSAKLVRVTGFLLLLFVPHEYSHDISYLAHGYGFLIGIVVALILVPYLTDRLAVNAAATESRQPRPPSTDEMARPAP